MNETMMDWEELLADPVRNDDISNAIWKWEASHHKLTADESAALAESVAQGIVDWYDLTGSWRNDFDTLVEYFMEGE